MLPESQVVAARKALEGLYKGSCTIMEQHKIQKTNKSTGFEEVVVLENQPCKLSFETLANTQGGGVAALVVQGAKVFLPPDVEVKPGSKLVITQNGGITAYKNSGEPAVYETHQEIKLELFKEWA